MRKILLIIVPIFLFTMAAFGQTSALKSIGLNPSTSSPSFDKEIIKIYPNPAFDFIGLNSVKNIDRIVVYNLVGRKMKNFEAVKGQRYDITDLPRGMYLVQLIGTSGKIVTTQRMSKK